ncbi:hypothetical protein [Streptomyces sp. NPDC000618]|uniref:hypothetical protein n=1 Tax=Streptomyces sp. NPDC000618 TaxID=3154265 RepID=UPI00332B2430
MDRTPFPPHTFARHKWLLNLFAALSLAAFFYVGGQFGAGALGVLFVLWSAALVFFGYQEGQRQLRAVEDDRARAFKAHTASMAERMLFAGREEGWEFEASCAETAVGFGRIPQDVPDRGLTEEEQVVARHAAGLAAEGVLRTRIDGFPVTVFDLEMINDPDVRELRRRCRFERAAEASKDYLTVVAVHLPVRLPYLASVHPFAPGSRVACTADDAFAEFLLSVPAVRAAALDVERLWSVQGDLLVSCALTDSGLDVADVVEVARRTARLAGAFPWSELERFRVEAPETGTGTGAGTEAEAETGTGTGTGQHSLWVHEFTSDLIGPQVRRWDEQRLGRTELRAFRSTHEWLSERAPAENLAG